MTERAEPERERRMLERTGSFIVRMKRGGDGRVVAGNLGGKAVGFIGLD